MDGRAGDGIDGTKSSNAGRASRRAYLDESKVWPDRFYQQFRGVGDAGKRACAIWRASGSVSGGQRFENVIVRDNYFQRPDGVAPNGSEKGVYFENNVLWDHVIIDNNLLDIGSTPANGISHPAIPSGGTMTTFNNLKPDNTFLQGRNRGNSTMDQELTSALKDLIIGV